MSSPRAAMIRNATSDRSVGSGFTERRRSRPTTAGTVGRTVEDVMSEEKKFVGNLLLLTLEQEFHGV